MNKDIIEVKVFDGDDGIKYIRYDDMKLILNRIKEAKEERDKEIRKLKEENAIIASLKHLFKTVVIKPDQDDGHYELFNISKQSLYCYLYILRCKLLKINFGIKPKFIIFDKFINEGGNNNEDN